MAHYEVRHHQYAVHLYALYQAKELPHLIHISTARLLRLAPLVLQNVVDVAVDDRMALLHVEPPSVPPLQRCV